MEQTTIFGASGFIGRHLVKRLVKTGTVIRVPTRDVEKAFVLKPMGDVAQVVPFSCSIRSDLDVARAIANSKTVINLIGILYEKGQDTFQSIHVEAAARIARMAKENGAKQMVHISALAANMESSSAYARSKAAGEEAVRTFFPDANIFRPSIVFGPEDNFFNKFASMVRIAPAVPLIGGGHTKFQPVYVGDVAEAMAKVLAKPEIRGQTYALGGPQIYTFREMMELMMDIINRRRALIDIPWPLAKLKATILELLPTPSLTRDQVELLKTDNVVTNGAKTFRDLGITPVAAEVILPTYLGRFGSKALRIKTEH